MGERICGTNNDGIAIFLSGPGINGPYTNGAENVALIPGTNEVVCVRNIHPQLDVAGHDMSYPVRIYLLHHPTLIFTIMMALLMAI